MLEVAKAEIAGVVKLHLARMTEGQTLTAERFLKLEDELTVAVTKGVIIGERYTHSKPTIPIPDLNAIESGESTVLPSVKPKIPSLPGRRRGGE